MSTPFAEVIGLPVAQSKSPAIHGFWLERLGLAGEYRATEVEGDALESWLDERRGDPDWRGCNVTMPHKQGVTGLVDRLDPVATRIGAVNTIYRDGAALVGTNTDAAGFLEPLGAWLEQRHFFRMARVMGTGGAARAIVAALADQGFTIVLAGRDEAKARALLDGIGLGEDHYAAPIDHFASPTDFAFDDREGCCDLVVNATPLGMRGRDPLQFHFSHAPPGSVAYDIVTDPVNTPFLADARAAGFATIDGLSMLIGQAAAAFELFFGRSPPREHDDALRSALLR